MNEKNFELGYVSERKVSTFRGETLCAEKQSGTVSFLELVLN